MNINKEVLPKSGFVWCCNEFIEDDRIDAIDIGIYMAICRFARNGTNDCFVSQSTLAELVGVSRPTVNKRIQKLVDLGYIKSDIRARKGGGRSTNRYTILDAKEAYKRYSNGNSQPDESKAALQREVPDESKAALQGTPHESKAALHPFNNNTFNNLTSNTRNTKSITRMPTGSGGTKQSTLIQMPKPASPEDQLPTIKNKAQLDAFLKGMKLGRPRSEMRLRLATLGKMDWELVSDVDFVYLYVDLHNKMMPTKLSVSSSPGVEASKLAQFRQHHGISKDQFVSIITKVLEIYKDHPNCEGVCHFGSLANAHFIFEPIVRSIKDGSIDRKNEYAEQIRKRLAQQNESTNLPTTADKSIVF